MIYIIVIEANFKIVNSLKIIFLKEHVRALISKGIKNITHFSVISVVFHCESIYRAPTSLILCHVKR